jgi:hypothetical protein
MINYSDKIKSYSFKDWRKIKSRLTSDILHGDSKADIEKKMNLAYEFLARIANLKLHEEEKEEVRSYLIEFFKNYVNDNNFVDQINSKAFNVPRKYPYSEYDFFIILPRYIFRAIAVHSPSQGDVDKCVGIIKKIPNPRVSDSYFRDLLNCIVIFSDGKTARKYLDNLKFESRLYRFKIRLMTKNAATPERAWETLAQEFVTEFNNKPERDKKEIKSNISTYLAITNYAFQEFYRNNYLDELPFDVYDRTNSELGKYYMAYEINLLLIHILMRKSRDEKLDSQYKRVKKINDLQLNKPTGKNIYLSVLKEILKRNDFSVTRMFEKMKEK